MNWAGKIIGGALGFMVMGPFGAVMGVAIGHQFDEGLGGGGSPFFGANQEQVQTSFFNVTFSVMGYLAKADGRVSEAEIRHAEQVMNKMGLMGEARNKAIRLFQQGKQTGFPFHETLAVLQSSCGRHRSLLRMFLEIQMQVAMADGYLKPEIETYLWDICTYLRFSRFEFENVKLRIQAQHGFNRQSYSQGSRYRSSGAANVSSNLEDCYSTLGIKSSANDQEVKKAYRKLISQHHPDKLVAKGLPEEMMNLAKEKTQQIRKAYETICKHRKI